ncbi:hypothetical protein BDY19DRAFT_988901 [Irpex rosettiformis]|uniref:Uncharacterized protein n=1 Tax=Irpex rosettiformis TaxID=378272 RepID=A0ACB8ULC7_9APHY|nr:hypothetical protein BDY19DRAFT_988901 [Irpex rosettiformis]
MAPSLRPIEPMAPRWEPTPDPNDIVVPGLDTTAPVNDQIDQIEQLITIRLQNIDANFSKIQQILANRILPAVKRYSVGTEPVREAAKFWTTFFEQAAQIRVPTYEEELMDPSQIESESAQETSTAASESEANTTSSQSFFNPDGTISESSFMPGSGAVMSTPATARQKSQLSSFANQDPTWNTSLESPLVRLDREIQSLTREEDVSVASSSTIPPDLLEDNSQDVTQRPLPPPSSAKSKGKTRKVQPLLRGVLERNTDVSYISPLKTKRNTPALKGLNPYLPPNTTPTDWKGVVDLSNPVVATPGRKGASSQHRNGKRSPSKTRTIDDFDLDDDSFEQRHGLSPPITMAFATAPKAKTPKLGQTPRKQAAERIMNSLLDLEKRAGFSSARPGSTYNTGIGASIESSLSNVPTPPSLSRYARHAYSSSADISNSLADASLESMMRRIGLNINDYGGGDSVHKADATTGSSVVPSLPPGTSYGSRSDSISASSIQKAEEAELAHKYDLARVRDDDEEDMNDLDDSSDSLDYDNQVPMNFAPPPPARDAFDDDDDDDDDDFMDGPSANMFGGGGDRDEMSNPFIEGMQAGGGDMYDDDDSFDDPAYESREEETLFGVPPAQRLAAQAALAQQRASEANFRMRGEELLQDTLGIGAQMAKAGRTEETPTPWPGGGR